MKIKVIASGSTGNCYRIDDGNTSLLLDCGILFNRIQEGCEFKTSDISGCLVTHRHGDHAKSVHKLIRRGINVYGPQDLANLEYGVKVIGPMEYFTIGTMKVLPFDVKHDVECYGYLIESMETGEKLVYVTDTAYIEYTFTGLTHIMIEANYSEEKLIDNVKHGNIPSFLTARIMKSHMSIDTTLDILKANDLSNVKQIYLLHLSNLNSDEEEFKKSAQKITGAEVYVF
jgi:phosphoribosyl 1,2-cyclic phosphodiesterase